MRILFYATCTIILPRGSASWKFLDTTNETLGKKIRQTKVDKIPYVIVVGDKEVSDQKLTVETRTGKLENVAIEQLIADLTMEIKDRK